MTLARRLTRLIPAVLFALPWPARSLTTKSTPFWLLMASQL